MPKYDITIRFNSVSFTLDTDDYEDDFAKTKNDLEDKHDPTDIEQIESWVSEYWLEYDLIDASDIDAAHVDVKPAK
jgi:hypothetical protein